ncbi:hypothetical protein L873DRAFT_1701156, partial [Choiromyces venosus 120613-1]
ATVHKDWTVEDFEGVIWSDECSVEKSKDLKQQWVFREPGEKWLADCICDKLPLLDTVGNICLTILDITGSSCKYLDQATILVE